MRLMAATSTTIAPGRAEPGPALVEHLSDREVAVLRHLASRLTYRESRPLCTSRSTPSRRTSRPCTASSRCVAARGRRRGPAAPADLSARPRGLDRRRPRPGVTAAATMAVLATGEGPGPTALATTAALATGDTPGVTAAATTAVLATGAPTTPARPRRAALMGMSGSLAVHRVVASMAATIPWIGIRPLAIAHRPSGGRRRRTAPPTGSPRSARPWSSGSSTRQG